MIFSGSVRVFDLLLGFTSTNLPDRADLGPLTAFCPAFLKAALTFSVLSLRIINHLYIAGRGIHPVCNVHAMALQLNSGHQVWSYSLDWPKTISSIRGARHIPSWPDWDGYNWPFAGKNPCFRFSLAGCRFSKNVDAFFHQGITARDWVHLSLCFFIYFVCMAFEVA